MEYMSIIAVLVNCALIGLSGQVHRMFPDMTATQTILLIVALEVSFACLSTFLMNTDRIVFSISCYVFVLL